MTIETDDTSFFVRAINSQTEVLREIRNLLVKLTAPAPAPGNAPEELFVEFVGGERIPLPRWRGPQEPLNAGDAGRGNPAFPPPDRG